MILPLCACRELPTIALASRLTWTARVPQAVIDHVRPGASTTALGHIVEAADLTATAAELIRLRSDVGGNETDGAC